MTLLRILNNNEIKIFDSPPIFNNLDRKKFLNISTWIVFEIGKLKSVKYKIGFILLLGYFKAVKKFFHPKKFNEKDIKYISNKLNLNCEKTVDFSVYYKKTLFKHKRIILEKFGVKYFYEKSIYSLILEYINFLVSKQLKPKLIFLQLLFFLEKNKIEIPNYNAINKIITDGINIYEKKLLNIVKNKLTDSNKILLDQLLCINDIQDEEINKKRKKYKLTMLKKINHSLKTFKIKENINKFIELRCIYNNIQKIIKELNLSKEVIQYYANLTIKSDVFRIKSYKNTKYLCLMSFVIHQYLKHQDALVDILLKSVKNTYNTAEKEHIIHYYKEKDNRKEQSKELFELLENVINTHYNEINVIQKSDLSKEHRFDMLEKSKFEVSPIMKEVENTIKLMKKDVEKSNEYYDFLDSNSKKLQNKVSKIVLNLDFNNETSDKYVIEAIEYYKLKNGDIDENSPLKFLNTREKRVVFNNNNKEFQNNLYKVLLFNNIANKIKGGSLNLKNSYRFKALEEYLFSKDFWHKRKKEIIENADLNEAKDFENFIKKYKDNVHKDYHKINMKIIQDMNKHVCINDDKKYTIKTPGVNKEYITDTLELFPQSRYISLLEILVVVNRYTNYLDSFEHFIKKNTKFVPDNKYIYAGIIGYGCNIGIDKIAKTSKNIKIDLLEDIINWYFSVSNINKANDNILEFINKLDLPNVYTKSDKLKHTSSDGQKYLVSVESLNANFSYKYPGRRKSLCVYTFIDERHLLFYSTVISAAEREAAYVIDGLMYNDVVKSDIHSTDTHGYTEIIFAITHLLGFAFAPRIKRLKEQLLYSFRKVNEYNDEKYKICPDKRINMKLIEDNWDDILRLIATIKLKETTASQLLKRLCSYSDSNPLYKALKEFGRIIKTLFILKYIDDLSLRQSIEKQLNKLESSNKFAKAVFFSNSQEFKYAMKTEQETAESCKRLIENSIICWNYLYLSQMIINAENEEQKNKIIDILKKGSIVTWEHVNLHGEYSFEESSIEEFIKFEIPQILSIKIV